MDAITASWLHKTGVTGSGSWNFGSERRIDEVQIYGSDGKIEFSVFDEQPISLEHNGKTNSLVIEHPENIQLYHVQNIKKHLSNRSVHPSTGESASHVAWVMDEILRPQ